VPEAERIRARAEVERPPVEDAVDRPAQRTAVAGDGREDEQGHARQPVGDLAGSRAPFRCVDAKEMGPGSVVAAVEQRLNLSEVTRRLVHVPKLAVRKWPQPPRPTGHVSEGRARYQVT